MKEVKVLAPLGVLAGMVWVSYGQLLEMYFWGDDYTHLYLAQHGLSSEFPYQSLTFLARLAWLAFGLEARKYFLLAIFLYILAAGLVFILAKLWFGRKDLAFFAALVFASGYVGQDGMKMLLGDGMAALVSLNGCLLSLVSLFKFLEKQRWRWLLAAYGFFWIALEAMPHRAVGLVVVMILGDWIFSRRGAWGRILLRNVGFLAIFLVEYLVRPYGLVLGHGAGRVFNRLALLNNFQWGYVVNSVGSFGNLFFPSFCIERLWQFWGGLLGGEEWQFWLSGLPSFVPAAVVIGLMWRVKRGSISRKKWSVIFGGILIWWLVWGKFVTGLVSDRLDRVFGLNGGVWLGLLLVMLMMRVPRLIKHAWFSLVVAGGLLAVFFFSKPDFLLVTNHRYLLIAAVVPSLVMGVFVTEEIYGKDKQKRRAAWGLFLVPALVLVLSHLWAGVLTQGEFVERYSVHAMRIYEDLKRYLPRVEKKTVIYIEGVSRELNFSVGDASRVGALGSEVAFAVNYETKKENIILPEKLGMVPSILRDNPDIEVGDVYTFIYDGNELRETSAGMRQLLSGGRRQRLRIPTGEWRSEEDGKGRSLRLVSDGQILTMLPMKLKVKLLMRPEKGLEANLPREVKISWEYDTYGLVGEDREMIMKVNLDGRWHIYEGVIPAGGEYLKELRINYNFPGEIVIGEGELEYL